MIFVENTLTSLTMPVSQSPEVLSVENLDFQVPVSMKEKIDAIFKYRYRH